MKWLLNKYNSFNQWVAVKLGNVLSSMTFFWVCVALDLIELPPVIEAHSVIIWCTYLSSVVFQLLALPVLGVLQKTGNDHHEKHSKKLDLILKHVKKGEMSPVGLTEEEKDILMEQLKDNRSCSPTGGSGDQYWGTVVWIVNRFIQDRV